MSTFLLKNPQYASEFIVADRVKPLHDKDMSDKKRGQIRVNFEAKFLEKFVREINLRDDKPGRLATLALSWWLRQPKYVRDWAFTHQDLPEHGEAEIIAAIQRVAAQDAAMDEAIRDSGEGKKRKGA